MIDSTRSHEGLKEQKRLEYSKIKEQLEFWSFTVIYGDNRGLLIQGEFSTENYEKLDRFISIITRQSYQLVLTKSGNCDLTVTPENNVFLTIRIPNSEKFMIAELSSNVYRKFLDAIEAFKNPRKNQSQQLIGMLNNIDCICLKDLSDRISTNSNFGFHPNTDSFRELTKTEIKLFRLLMRTE